MISTKPKKRTGPSFKRKGWMSQKWQLKGVVKPDPKDGRMPEAEEFAPESHLTEQDLRNLL